MAESTRRSDSSALGSAFLRAVTAGLTTSLMSLQPAAAEAGPPRNVLVEQPCAVATLPDTAQCGVLLASENRWRPTGRMLRLRYGVVPGVTESKSGPLFLLAGGPGQSALDEGSGLLKTIAAVHDGDGHCQAKCTGR